MQTISSKSTESLYSTNSSKYSAGAAYTKTLYHQGKRNTVVSSSTRGTRSGEVRQRVLSARKLRVKTLQNQLADAQLHIAELAQENRILRTLHKRQDNALSKYENTSSELPQLLHSHSEEIRVLQAKIKNLQNQNKELATKLKQKDNFILNLSDQNKHLNQLNNDKSLEERERLTERVRYLEQILNEKESEINLISRKLLLEKKSYKNQLHSEHSKYKDLLNRIEKNKSDFIALPKLDPLGIVDKLAKVSILPKTSGDREKIEELKIHANSSVPSNNQLNVEKELRGTISKSKINVGNDNMKNGRLNRSAYRSVSPKLTSDFDLKTPSPITMRRKSSLKDNKDNLDNRVKPNSIDDAFEMNISSFKNECDKFSVQSSQSNLKEYSNWKNNCLNTEIETNEFEIDIFKTYDENRFDDKRDNTEEGESKYEYDEINEPADVIESSAYSPSASNDLSKIKHKIMTDYENREKFLDTICRDSSNDANSFIKDDSKKTKSVDTKKKTKLLAALKAIDEKGSKE